MKLLQSLVAIGLLAVPTQIAIGQCESSQHFFYAYDGVQLNPLPTICEIDTPDGRLIRITLRVNRLDGILTIRPSGPARVIRDLDIRVDRTSGAPANAYLLVNVSGQVGQNPSQFISRVDRIGSNPLSSQPIIPTCTGVGQIGRSNSDLGVIWGAGVGLVSTIKNVGYTGATGDAYVWLNAHGFVPTGDLPPIVGNFDNRTCRIEGGLFGIIQAQGIGPILDVPSGACGDPVNPVSVSVKNLPAISATSIDAVIVTNSTDGTDSIGRLETTSGDLRGIITTSDFSPTNVGGVNTTYIRVARDLAASITVRENIENKNGFEAGVPAAAIRVGRNWLPSAILRVGGSTWGPVPEGAGGFRISAANGLQGQIIIGATNPIEYSCAFPGGGRWGGAAVIGPTGSATTLDPSGCAAGTTYTPYYAATSASIGGGAVGLVPYRIHESDCIPLRDANDCVENLFVDRVWPSGTTRRTMIIRHYGPITDKNPSDSLPPVVIKRQSRIECTPSPTCPGGLPPIVDVTNQFDVRIASPTAGTPAARELWIAPKATTMWDPFILTEYTINLRKANQSAPGELQSETYTGNKPAVLG